MPYVLLSDLPADIPPDFLTQALDDDGDGVQDPGLWDLIAQQVSDAIDGDIGVRFAVPLVPNLGRYPLTNGFPPVIVNAGRTLAAEKLYGRRGTADQRNPWASRANAVRSQLELIGKGKLPLDPNDQRADPSASIVTQRLQTVSHGARLSL
jgi:hypothetical protein